MSFDLSLGTDALRALPALIVGFLAAAAITLAATPIVRRYARRFGMVDRPEARRVNTKAIARGGGVAILLGFVIVAFALLVANSVIGLHFVDRPQIVTRPKTLALLGGAVLAVGVGLLDDWFQLRARWQFIGQFVLAGVAVALGVAVTIVNNPFSANGTLVIPGAFVVVATLIWIVGMINSMNFIDGLDGLSSGIALIAAVTLGVINLTADPVQPYVAMFCFVLAGALAGFLRWNFHPASIFAGTSGIMLVGYVLAVLSILGSAKIAVAALVLGVPIMDTFWIVVRRVASGRSPFAADRSHIHHRLLDLGLSHRGTVLLIYVVCVLLAVLSLVLSGENQLYAFLGLVVLFGLALFFIERLGGGAGAIEQSLDADSYSDGEKDEPALAETAEDPPR
ncbi:MAG TPA: MraY family glycosyltransferase [Terriglobales bacterium]|nr:MraY family glycosyltransferase [Terriglobales bacterium]